VDKALVIFPSEEKFYRDHDVDAEFVGHPLADLPRPKVSREEYAKEFDLDASKQWITLMPGSRRKEVRMNLPGILASAAMLGDGFEFPLPVAPTLDTDYFAPFLIPARKVRERVHLVPEALPALAHSRAGIIASGTATVEAALMELPFVMVYRVTALTYLLGRSAVKVPHFAMVNLIAGEQVVLELVQQDFTPERAVAEIRNILPDGQARTEMVRGLHLVRTQLSSPAGTASAPARAAAAVRKLLRHSALAQFGREKENP